MSAAKTVTATFASNVLKVTLSRVGGASGTVTRVGNGIDCGQFCQAGFPPDYLATLTATPAPGSVFTKWTGVHPADRGDLHDDDERRQDRDRHLHLDSVSQVNITGAGTIVSTPPGTSCTLKLYGTGRAEHDRAAHADRGLDLRVHFLDRLREHGRQRVHRDDERRPDRHGHLHEPAADG